MTTKYPVVVPGVGPVPAPGMIIGEAPGRTEIEKGTPFCGRSGGVLDDALKLHGETREALYITNVFKGDVGSGNRNPTSDEVEDHRNLLQGEIDAGQPRAILLLGRFAVVSFFPDTERMGSVVSESIRYGDALAFPCWHPAYVLRKSGLVAVEFYETVGRFVEYIRS